MYLNVIRLDKVTKMLFIIIIIWGSNYQCNGRSSTNQKF